MTHGTDQALTVRTDRGTVAGAWAASGVRVWRGVPYAAPPVGPARFRAPASAARWEGTRDATRFGLACPQPPLAGVPPREPTGGDCLVLNVWSPAEAAGLPVLVWIHGGAYLVGSGSAPLSDGAGLALAGPLVVVSLNYRLGHLGFLDLAGLPGAAGRFDSNLGLRDQLAALGWVQRNIEAFGGDPARVTIAGQSAGGASVCCLLASPLGRGLFAGAIAQSPPASSIFDRQRARHVTRRFLELTGRPGGDLEGVEEAALLEASGVLLTELTSVYPGHHAFQPVVDGEVLLDMPIRSLAAGEGSPVPLLIGSNEDEGSLFVRPPMPPLIPTSEQAVRLLLEQDHPGRAERVLAAYEGHGRWGPLVALGGDAMVNMPALAVAEAQSRRAPTFVYRFRWSSPDLLARRLGTPHTLDVPFVFGTPGEYRLTALDGGPGSSAGRVSAAMQAAWLGFVRGGAPGEAWPRHEAPDRAALVIGEGLEVATDLDGPRRVAWEPWW